MSTKERTHKVIAAALAEGAALTHEQRALLMGLVADDKVWQDECSRLRAELAAVTAERDAASEKADHMSAAARTFSHALRQITLMARTSGGWQPDAKLIAACEQAEQVLSLSGMSQIIDGRDDLKAKFSAVTAERDALLAAIRQQWELLPLLPYAPPATYARGYNDGARDTLTAIRAAIAASKPAPERCTYPKCECPFDAPADPNWCARGLA